MAASDIKFTYFNLQGKGETIRLVLAAAGVKYEEKKIDFPEWGPMKESTPFGQLPLITVDGLDLAQSCTIIRYLARKFNLAGDGEEGFAYADMMLEHTQDYIKEFVTARFAKTPEEKQAQCDKLLQTFLPKWLGAAENMLKKRGGVWFSSDKLTYGDLAMDHALFWISWKEEKAFEGTTGCDERFNMMDKYPLLKANYERVGDIPEIKAYVASRPKAAQQVNGWGL